MDLHEITGVLTPRAAEARPRIALGTMNFGKRTPSAESERIVRRALERGVSIFDTANVYNDGESERILGRALGASRGASLVASKVGLGRVGRAAEGLSRAAIERAIEGSLERLGTNYLDVYYLHAPDRATPIEETLDAMHALLDSGRVRAWGISNYASWQILETMNLADARKMPRPAISQVIYNLLIRQIEVEYVAFTRRYPIHNTVYNGLAGGLLSGKYALGATLESDSVRGSRFDTNPMYQRRYWTEKMFDRVAALSGVAMAEGLSLVELSYAWLAGRPGVDSILVGPATTSQLDVVLDACDRYLSPDAIATIDSAYKAWMGTDTHYVR